MELTLVQKLHQSILKRQSNTHKYPYKLSFNDSSNQDQTCVEKTGFIFARDISHANAIVDQISANYSRTLSNRGIDNWYGTKMSYSPTKKHKYAQMVGTVFGVRRLLENTRKGYALGGLTPFSLLKLVHSNVRTFINKFLDRKVDSDNFDEHKKSMVFILFLICLVLASSAFFGLIAIIVKSASIFSILSYILIVILVLALSVITTLWQIIWPNSRDAQDE